MKKHEKKAVRKGKFAKHLLNSKGVSSRARQIYDYHTAHLAELDAVPVHNSYWQYFELFHEEFSECILDLNHKKKKNWGDLQTKTAILVSKMPKTFFSVHYLAARGYYYESLATLRIVYEILLRILYIQKFPAEVDLVVMNASVKKGNNFKASQVLPHHYKTGSEPSDPDRDNLYRFLSYNQHGMVHNVLKDMIASRQNGGTVLELGYEYKPELFSVSMNLLLVVLYMSLRSFIAIFDPVTIDLYKPNYKPLVEAIKQMKLQEHLKTTGVIVNHLQSS